MKSKMIPHSHPGETLKEDFMEPHNLTAYKVAKVLGVSQTSIGQIIHGTRAITPAMALRLEILTGASAQFWINLQTAYDLAKARADKDFKAELLVIAANSEFALAA